MTHQSTTIALNKLVAWQGNVRKTNADEGIEELAASIAAHGLLQSLVVRPAGKGAKRGKYAVVAGQRRLLALQSLAKAKAIAADTEIPCVIAAGDLYAAELSLAENAVRVPMHPADQFEAFRDLVDAGSSIADIAARFGCSETLVAKRLKLGRVSPVIMAAYRTGEIGLELVQAFTVTDDTTAQERVFAESPLHHLRPRSVRLALTEGEIPSTDKRVKLIGLEAYEAAGGAIRRDLFDPEDGGYVLDAELLDRLVMARLESEADPVRSEGWKWIEVLPELGYEYLSGFERRWAEDVPLSEQEQAEFEALTAEYDELCDSDDEADNKRCDEIDARLDELNERSEFWPDDTLEIAGVIVSLSNNGTLRIERGLIRPEDKPAKPRKPEPEGGNSADEPAIKLSAKLIEDLTAQKSAAISAELAKRADVALAAIVHTLVLQAFYRGARHRSCLKLSFTSTHWRGALSVADECTGLAAIDEAYAHWSHVLPGNPAGLWSWCLSQEQDTLLSLLAVIASRSVNAVIAKHERPDSADKRHANRLAQALALDMGQYFTPTSGNFFSRISGSAIQAAICEAKAVTPAPGWAKLKKAELASLAERQIADTNWLPEPLRIADESESDSDDSEADDLDGDDIESEADLAEAAE